MSWRNINGENSLIQAGFDTEFNCSRESDETWPWTITQRPLFCCWETKLTRRACYWHEAPIKTTAYNVSNSDTTCT